MRMKKKVSLFLVVLLSITAIAATQALRRASSTTVTYALSEGDSFTSGQTVDVKNGDEVVATITYGESSRRLLQVMVQMVTSQVEHSIR